MNTCRECETKGLFSEGKIYCKNEVFAYSHNLNIQRELDLLASDIVILGTKFLLLLQYFLKIISDNYILFRHGSVRFKP